MKKKNSIIIMACAGLFIAHESFSGTPGQTSPIKTLPPIPPTSSSEQSWMPLDTKDLIENSSRAILEHPDSIFDVSVPRSAEPLKKWLETADFIDAYVSRPLGTTKASKSYPNVSYYGVAKKDGEEVPRVYAAYFIDDHGKLDLATIFGAIFKKFEVRCIKMSVPRDNKKYHDYMATLDDGRYFFVTNTRDNSYVHYRICLPIT